MVYEETIHGLQVSLEKAKIHDTERHDAIKNLTLIAQSLEKGFEPVLVLENMVQRERAASKYVGRSAFEKTDPPKGSQQLTLF